MVWGCAPLVDMKRGRSPLAPLALPQQQTVGLDILVVRYPASDEAAREALWQQVDEQVLPIELRQKLRANGFRAGVVGPQLPDDLEKLIHLTDQPEQDETQLEAAQLTTDAPVRQRYVQIMNGKQTNIICTGEQTRHGELSVLIRGEDGSVTGKTFRKVAGQLTTRAFTEPDGRIRLELTPEVEHGEAQRRFEPADGMMRVDFSPPREKYDALRMTVTLAPGQMLLVTAVPDRPGTLGHHYFNERGQQRDLHKLLIVRPAYGSAGDDLFSE